MRTLRRSDGTIPLQGRRFEVPGRYRHLPTVEVRYAQWDLARAHMVDAATGEVLCRLFPQDKARNADGLRRSLDPISPEVAKAAGAPPAGGMAPLLKALLDERAATGLPPAYLPKDEGEDP